MLGFPLRHVQIFPCIAQSIPVTYSAHDADARAADGFWNSDGPATIEN